MAEEKNIIKNVAIYVRVSTDEQAKEGFSLPAQIDKLKAFCISRDWNVFKIYQDPGFSGRNIKRPGYTEMLANINNWDGILVLKMDRIHRNTKNFLVMMSELEKHNKEFISSMESLDTSSAMGRFVMQIIQSIAQLESEQISERVTFALTQKMKATKKYMGHNPPFGYKSKKGELIPIKEELDLVKKIFKLYNEGNSYRDIEKITGIYNTSIRQYLQNPCYSGFERWKRWIRKAPYYQKIIPIQTWNKTQQLMRSKARKQSKRLMIELKDQDFIDIPKIRAIKMSRTGVNRPKQHPL